MWIFKLRGIQFFSIKSLACSHSKLEFYRIFKNQKNIGGKVLAKNMDRKCTWEASQFDVTRECVRKICPSQYCSIQSNLGIVVHTLTGCSSLFFIHA